MISQSIRSGALLQQSVSETALAHTQEMVLRAEENGRTDQEKAAGRDRAREEDASRK